MLYVQSSFSAAYLYFYFSEKIGVISRELPPSPHGTCEPLSASMNMCSVLFSPITANDLLLQILEVKSLNFLYLFLQKHIMNNFTLSCIINFSLCLESFLVTYKKYTQFFFSLRKILCSWLEDISLWIYHTFAHLAS